MDGESLVSDRDGDRRGFGLFWRLRTRQYLFQELFMHTVVPLFPVKRQFFLPAAPAGATDRYVGFGVLLHAKSTILSPAGFKSDSIRSGRE
jgi:hypothetical protein